MTTEGIFTIKISGKALNNPVPFEIEFTLELVNFCKEKAPNSLLTIHDSYPIFRDY